MDSLVRHFEAAASDRRHGAVEIEGRLVAGLLREEGAWTTEALAEGAALLRTGQPAMANLRNLARVLVEGDVFVVKDRLRRRSLLLSELDERLAIAAWPRIEDRERILTISRSSSVAATLLGAWKRGWRGEVAVFDGSPVGRGEDQAATLAETIERVRSQPDATMSSWFGEERTSVLIGADAVSPRRVINVCGTAALLELAAAREMPTVVVADSGKDLADDELDGILEAGPVAAETGPDRRWRIFEAAPMDLVTERVSE